MKKIQVINGCKQCVFHLYRGNDLNPLCCFYNNDCERWKELTKVDQTKESPSFCPLPNAGENKDED